jgi:hypothetical protein
MHGLEAVADVREGAANNDRHRVVEIRTTHLLFDVDRNQIRVGRNTAFKRELGGLVVCHGVFSKVLEESGKQDTEMRGRTPGALFLFYAPGPGFHKANRAE